MEIAPSVKALRQCNSTNGEESKLIFAQAQALRNLGEILNEAGSSLKNVVKVTVFLDDMANFAAMNRVYDSFFQEHPKPVRLRIFSTSKILRGRQSADDVISVAPALLSKNCL